MHIHIPNTRCKFRYKSRFVLDYRKKNKFLTVYRRKKVPFLSEISLFCISQNTKYFISRFLPVFRNMCTYSHICFKIFLSIESVFFKKFKYQRAMKLGSCRHFSTAPSAIHIAPPLSVMKRVRVWVQDYKLFGDKKEVQSVSETRWKLLGENALKINI